MPIASPKILVIDDEPVVVDSTCKVLSLLDACEVYTAPDAETALSILDQESIAVLISDVMLPQMSGFDLLETTRERHPELPVILISGYATHDKVVESFTKGAFDFVGKPYEIDELLAVVQRSLRFASSSELISSRAAPQAEATYYVLNRHSWCRLEADGNVVVGVGPTISELIDPVTTFVFRDVNSEISQGNECAQLITETEWTHRVWSPISGHVIQKNPVLEKTPDVIRTDPYTAGWVMRLIPHHWDEEIKYLTKFE